MQAPVTEEKKPLYPKTLSIDDFIAPCQPIVENFKCPLCEGIFFNPVSDSCGHLFCSSCFHQYILTSTECPIEHKVLNVLEIKAMPVVSGILDKQIIKCKNREKGCHWQGKLCEFQEHIDVHCLKQLVSCSNEGCSEKSMREEMNKHLTNCNYRIVKCPDCQLSLPFIQLIDHQKVCPKFKLECPQKCGLTIMREEITSHIQEVCENTEIPCPYSDLGCKEKMYKRDLNKHLNNENINHLLYFFKEMENFKKNIFEKMNSKVDEKLNSSKSFLEDFINQKLEDFKRTNNIGNKQKDYMIDKQSEDTMFLGKKHDRITKVPTPQGNIKKGQPISQSNHEPKKNSNREAAFQTEIEKELQDYFDGNISSGQSNSSSEPPNINGTNFTQDNTPNRETAPKPPQNKDDFNNIFDVSSLPPGVIVKENSVKCVENQKTEHKYIFTKFDIDMKNPKITEWQVIFHPYSCWIGVGLCDRKQVIENDLKFFATKSLFKSGTFCISTNGYTWNGNMVSENNIHINSFPIIKEGEVGSFYYYPEKKELQYKIGKKYTGKLTQVYPTKGDHLTVCVLLLNPKDEVEFRYIK